MNDKVTAPTENQLRNMSLDDIADMVHDNARNKGFHPTGQPIEVFVANQMNNIHAEVSEHWDAWRAGTQFAACDKAEKMSDLGLRPLNQCEEEMADLFIRCLDVSRRLGVDIVAAVAAKHAYNTTRPHMHGKKN